MRINGIIDYFKKQGLFLIVISFCLFASCATMNTTQPATDLKAITAEENGTLLANFSPVFMIEQPEKPYNLIGTPMAQVTKDLTEKVFVNPEKPTIYYETRRFQTSRSTYTNLVFRVHFEKVPLNFFPLYLGAGENVGLLVIATLNLKDQPVLYTLVHTCGCYLAFIPTSYMPEQAFPKSWDKGRQTVYSENLPGMLKYPRFDKEIRLVLTLRNATHRIKDAWLSDKKSLGPYLLSTAPLAPLDSLETLPLGDRRFTSFYEISGPRTDYVKSSTKIWERFFMSWWTFDWRIGEDKKLGKNKNDSIQFYTSLPPWNRDASDMRDFKTFLKFWGWNL